MTQETLHLPDSPKLRGVLERKREHFKERTIYMGKLGPETWDPRIAGLCSRYGYDYSLLHFLLKNGKVNPLHVASLLYDSMPQESKDVDARMYGNPNEARARFITNVLVSAREWKGYMRPIEGVPDEFFGLHDRGHDITLPFPGRTDDTLILQVDDLRRIRNAFPDSKGITTPIHKNYLGIEKGYMAMAHGSLSFPSIGVINTGRKRLEALEKGDRIDVIPSSGAGQVIHGSEILKIEPYVHDPRQDGGQFKEYLRNLPSAVMRDNPFEGMFKEEGEALTGMVREGGEALANIFRLK